MTKYSLLLFCSLILSPFWTFAQKEQYQGLFLYQFSKYIKWPDSYNSGDFVITVIGNEKSVKSIKDMADAKKQTQGMNIVVQTPDAVNQIDQPHIIFIEESKTEVLSSVIQKVENQPVLIVTEGPGLAEKGSIVNFVIKDGKMRFELNKNKAESIGLKVSSSLTSLAIII